MRRILLLFLLMRGLLLGAAEAVVLTQYRGFGQNTTGGEGHPDEVRIYTHALTAAAVMHVDTRGRRVR